MRRRFGDQARRVSLWRESGFEDDEASRVMSRAITNVEGGADPKLLRWILESLRK